MYIHDTTGWEKIESFHGAHQADAPIVIAQVDDARTSNLAYARAKVAEPTSLPKTTFFAILNGVAGEYDLSGHMLRAVPMSIVSAAYVPSEQSYYALDGDTVRKYDATGMALVAVAVGLDVPTMSNATGIVYDSRNQRIVVVTLGGEGFLYAYDLRRKSWSVISSMNNADWTWMSYDPSTGHFFGSAGAFPDKLPIDDYDANGKPAGQLAISYNKLPGIEEMLGGEYGLRGEIRPIFAGDLLILPVGSYGPRSTTDTQQIYLYERVKQSGILTWSARVQ